MRLPLSITNKDVNPREFHLCLGIIAYIYSVPRDRIHDLAPVHEILRTLSCQREDAR